MGEFLGFGGDWGQARMYVESVASHGDQWCVKPRTLRLARKHARRPEPQMAARQALTSILMARGMGQRVVGFSSGRHKGRDREKWFRIWQAGRCIGVK